MGSVIGDDGMMDAELVLRFQGGEESAFDTLVRSHMKDAYAFCLRLTHDPEAAEELSQQGFVSAYRALRRFRGESSFRSWLYRIFINQYRDRLRRGRRSDARLEVVRDEARRRPAEEPAGSELRADELADVVRRKVETLPDRQREVLVLHAYQGMEYTDIASALGCSYDDVKMNLSLARKRLRQELKEYL